MDSENLNLDAPIRLRLARSHDEGRTFIAETIPVTRVIDKQELAVSPDDIRIAIVYESSQGPKIVTTPDGGKTWNEARVVEPGKVATSGPRRSPFQGMAGRLFAVWAEGEREYRTGNVWFNGAPLTTK